MKRLLAVITCLAILCVFSGCQEGGITPPSSTDPTADVGTIDTLTLAYNKEDTLNPFAAKTEINLQLATLLYETPVNLSAAFMPQNALLSVEMPDPTRVVATVRAGAKFSDGTAVTAEDVRFSFEQAKGSANFAALLSNFRAVTVKGGTLTFTLASADNYAAANLIFPVIKRTTATTDAGKAPVGSGPYTYHPDTATLTANPYYGKQPTFPTVALKHLISDAAVHQAVENGSIHYTFDDLSGGDIPRTAMKDTAVDLTRLVYLGVNGTRPLTNSATFRRGLSAAINRTAIAANSYTGRAKPATSPFHPLWGVTGTLSASAATDDTVLAKSLIKKAAETPIATPPVTAATTVTGTTTAPTTAATSAPATGLRPLTLIYTAGNTCRESAVKTVVKALADCGVTVTPAPLSYAEYIARLQNGDFDLYLGEIQLSPNMNLSVFFRAGGAAAYGVNTASATATAYTALREGSGTPQAFITAFGEDMPYIPLCWRQGMAAYSKAFSSVTPSAFDPFNGISEWK